jgi:hypothetical protein
MPEFLAIPVVIVVLGLVFLILLVGDAGVTTWLVAGAVSLIAIVAVAVVLARRPRSPSLSSAEARFEGGAPPLEDGVNHLLLVIDEACSTDEIASLTRGRAEGTSVFFVVAPAVSSRVARWTGDEQAYAQAQQGLDTTVSALAKLGFEATGHVGSHDPLQATDEALREFPADEIVFALHGGNETEWIEQGVPELARRRYSVPVRELTPSLRTVGDR